MPLTPAVSFIVPLDAALFARLAHAMLASRKLAPHPAAGEPQRKR
jgi:hypothetical protein